MSDMNAPPPLRIGLSPRFLFNIPRELGFRGKVLQYLEQSIAHWAMAHGALTFMLPSIDQGGIIHRSDIHVADYVDELDGLILQGGADVSPTTYGEMPMQPVWGGDRVRDVYEIELLHGFVDQGKPVLGVCRGAQIINVAFGGTLYQDIETQLPGARRHFNVDLYDRNYHEIDIASGSRLAALYPGLATARVNTIHHQAVRTLGDDMVAEAHAAGDQVIEAIRWTGPSYVFGVQWHPEFHEPGAKDLLDSQPIMLEFLDAARAARKA